MNILATFRTPDVETVFIDSIKSNLVHNLFRVLVELDINLRHDITSFHRFQSVS